MHKKIPCCNDAYFPSYEMQFLFKLSCDFLLQNTTHMSMGTHSTRIHVQITVFTDIN